MWCSLPSKWYACRLLCNNVHVTYLASYLCYLILLFYLADFLACIHVGIVPFHGFSLFSKLSLVNCVHTLSNLIYHAVAPISFLFDRPDHLLVLFKAMYTRYFIHLHCVSSHPDVSLLICFYTSSLRHVSDVGCSMVLWSTVYFEGNNIIIVFSEVVILLEQLLHCYSKGMLLSVS